ncbi:hypothetical protein LZ554_004682 [Drepanopeziza brunnea f. sp. 'monogermtubi']|nr:hypothetical protein LZ554_004682 [Drepanopeziza brunnea f. sp. 'monogermtubi']
MKLFLPVSLLTALFTLVSAAPAAVTEYEYVVVGSGAGGGPLACRLARAGHKTLLIEAGDDQTGNDNTTIPAFQGLVAQDAKLRWDYFVNHYQDQARAQQDFKYSWEVSPYNYHVAKDGPPPAGAKPLGILYPRAGTLGGCVTHNALIFITPHASDWNGIAATVGDNSWSAPEMNKYLDKVYEWLPVNPTDPTILTNDLKLTQHLAGGAAAIGQGPSVLTATLGITNALLADPNSRLVPERDSKEGFYQVPLIHEGGARVGVRDFIASTVAQGYPLTVRTNCFVTKILFDTTGATPKATGVEFLDGKQLYRASPLSGGTGVKGTATVTKDLIISAGAFNTPQLLKLSGIGPQEELAKFGIPLIKHLPGVGTNLQDRYEIPVVVKHGSDFNVLAGCTFDAKAQDMCYTKYKNSPNVLALRGAYATNGLAATLAVNSDFAANSDIDLYIFAGPVNFRGYFPQWADDIVKDHKHFGWTTLKAHTRNRAGTVELSSADPLDRPIINFNYFDTGNTTRGEDVADLNAMIQAIKISRNALQRYKDFFLLGGDSFVEESPGPSVQSDADIGDYIKRNAWGHHASCSMPLGSDSDPMAVLDAKFRVRGVQNLRVVDASVFPQIPGIFIQSAIFMVAEKAADVILNP